MVRQFDVYPHPTPKRAVYPYLLVLQHDCVPAENEVIVAPMSHPTQTNISRLYPVVYVQSRPMMLLAPAIGRIPTRLLLKPIANVIDSRNRIIAALDMLFAGS